MRRITAALCLSLAGCASAPPASSSAPAAARGPVDDPALAELLEDHWSFVLEADPLFATHLGIRKYDDRLPDQSRTAIDARRSRAAAFLGRAQHIPTEGLTPRDRVTLRLFIEELQYDQADAVCQFETWSVGPRGNPVVDWNYLAELHTVESPSDLENLILRYKGIPKAIDDHVANLRRGAAAGLFPNAESTRRTLEMADKQLAQPLSEWPLTAPARAAHPDWSEATRSELAQQLEAVVKDEIKPALTRYRDLLKAELLPKARAPEASGLAALPIGEACYAARIRRFTTLPLDAKAVHETGLKEIARIDAEMAALGKKLFGLEDRMEVLAKLRSDPELHFQTSQGVEAKAASALAKAKAAIPRFFGVLPEADCVVRRIPDYEAPYTTIAYYRQPSPDGARPGEYFINVYAPKTRPRYEAEALAYHESIPGHHLQIAIAQELPALPEFRKHLGMTVFVEGWALYAEQLSEEMGLYEGELDRMGMLSFEAWRAARLVVDTGIHAFGWSREKAKAFMMAHTALAANNVDNEVDRYIVWPGQALAYKTGQMEIWRLRREAERTLADRFDLPGFHDVVLGGGAVSLPVLQDRVRAWVKSRAAD